MIKFSNLKEALFLMATGEHLFSTNKVIINYEKKPTFYFNGNKSFTISRKHYTMLKNSALSTSGYDLETEEIYLCGSGYHFIHKAESGYSPLLTFWSYELELPHPFDLIFKSLERIFNLSTATGQQSIFTLEDEAKLRNLKPIYYSNLSLGLEQLLPTHFKQRQNEFPKAIIPNNTDLPPI